MSRALEAASGPAVERASTESELSAHSFSSMETLELEEAIESGTHVGLLGQPSAALTGIVEEKNKSNLQMAFMNMANSIIGAGIIGQAYAMRQAGFVAGVSLLVLLTVAIDWTIRLMVTNAKLSGTKTYQSTVKFCFGRPGLLVISLAQGLFAFCGSMAYCIIIGDTVPHVIRALFPRLDALPVVGLLAQRNSVIVFFVMGISYPLSLHRDIGALAKASALALASMVVILIVVVVRGPMVAPKEASLSLPLWTLNKGVFQAISVISFAFVCHHNSLLIYDSLKTPTIDRFARVTHWSTGVSMVACLVLAVAGFLSFKDQTKGNVLNNFPVLDTMANIARFCFGFNMVTTLPLEIFVCREVILEYAFPHQPITKLRHVVVTTALVLLAMSVGLATCNLGVILELAGSSSACTMAYILPPMCYLKLSSKQPYARSKLACYGSVIFGATVMVISTLQSIFKLFQGTEVSHCTS